MYTSVDIKSTVLYGTIQSPLVHMLGPEHIFPSPRHFCVFHKCHVPDLNITSMIVVQTKISSINRAVASNSDFEKKKFVCISKSTITKTKSYWYMLEEEG